MTCSLLHLWVCFHDSMRVFACKNGMARRAIMTSSFNELVRTDT